MSRMMTRQSRLKSNLDMFAVRGDHWTDNRFVRDEFKALSDEYEQGPDMDRWTRASFKNPARQRRKASNLAIRPRKSPVKVCDLQRKLVNIAAKARISRAKTLIEVK